jgi:hypothetical protein
MTLMSTIKAGALAVALSAGAFAVAPAQAAGPTPNFGFSFNFGNGGGPGVYFNYGGNPKYACLSDQQIYWQLKSYGFKKVQIVKSKGYYVIAVARYQGDWYQIAINRCSGKIKKAPLYGYSGYGNNYGNGITLQFGF